MRVAAISDYGRGSEPCRLFVSLDKLGANDAIRFVSLRRHHSVAWTTPYCLHWCKGNQQSLCNVGKLRCQNSETRKSITHTHTHTHTYTCLYVCLCVFVYGPCCLIKIK